LTAADCPSAGATPVAIKLTVPDFAVNWDEVRAAITRARMIINTPHPERSGLLSRRPAAAGG
jgi:aspartate/methionine/tyrosine aminotransferase